MKKFTLLELLVVVAIIGILLTLLLPSLKKARTSAKKAVCKSNNRQIHTLQMIYSKNNNAYFTMSESIDGGSFSWDDYLSEYDGRNLSFQQKRNQSIGLKEDHSFEIYTCPLAVKRHESEPSRNYAMNRGWYRNNGHINGVAWNEGSIKISKVDDTSTMVLYEMDECRLRLGRVALGNNSDAYYRGSWSNWSTHHGKLHTVNVLEVNGSVSEQSLVTLSIWSRTID